MLDRRKAAVVARDLDELDARLRDSDEGAALEARLLLHGLVENSSPRQLRVLLATIRSYVDCRLKEETTDDRTGTGSA